VDPVPDPLLRRKTSSAGNRIQDLKVSSQELWPLVYRGGFVAKPHLLKLQRLQNNILHTIGNFPRGVSVRDVHPTFHIPYVYDYITKLPRQQAKGIRNHENENVRNIRRGVARHRKYKRLELGGS
jgi:hypothetical protein